MVLSGRELGFAELLSGNNFKPSFIYDTSISDFKNKKGQKIYKIKIQELQLLECLIIFQVIIVVIILRTNSCKVFKNRFRDCSRN